jgi:hypothetical protein
LFANMVIADRTVRIPRPSPLYIDVIIRRYQAETGAAAIFADSGETFEKLVAHRRNDESDERH